MDNSTSNNDGSMDGTANTMDMTGALGGLLSNPHMADGSMEKDGVLAMMLQGGDTAGVMQMMQFDSDSMEGVMVLPQTGLQSQVMAQPLTAGSLFYLMGFDFDKVHNRTYSMRNVQEKYFYV